MIHAIWKSRQNAYFKRSLMMKQERGPLGPGRRDQTGHRASLISLADAYSWRAVYK